MDVRIKTLSLVNFKGTRSASVDFGGSDAAVYGCNASGKTTLFDAFTWVLFGKSSEDKTKFGIKTLDADGKVIDRIPHEVTAVLDVDGEEVRITRRLEEKWVKRRGTAEEEFKGNEETRLYNDVPLSVREFSDKINAIITEEHFKAVTNPLYFTSLGWQRQREMLIGMAGDVTADEVVETDPDSFRPLIDKMGGKTMEEYRREIGAAKKRIKEEMDGIPSRIDERRRSNVTEYDWNLLEARLHHKETKIREITDAMSDAGVVSAQLRDMMAEKTSLAIRIEERRQKVISDVRLKDSSRRLEWQKAQAELKAQRMELETARERLGRYEQEKAGLMQRREELLTQWKEIKGRRLEIASGALTCPTCGRVLEVDQQEAALQEMTERLNAQKAADLEKNKVAGTMVRADLVAVINNIACLQDIERNAVDNIAKLEASQQAEPEPTPADRLEEIINDDAQYKRLSEELSRLSAALKEKTEAADSEDGAKEELEAAKAELDALRKEAGEMREKLAMREVVQQNELRIKELEEQLRNLSLQYAELEGVEFAIQLYARKRIDMLETRINSMFSFVRFRMYEQQINGGEVETCKAMVDGVPYEDLNHAARINAGLDIIAAFCRRLGVSAPIFVDNAEAVNRLMTDRLTSQIIRLIVSGDKNLKIEKTQK